MSTVSTLYFPYDSNPPGPTFNREGPFRYFDLPPEIRDQILRLLLVRGNVALGNDGAIKNRFRHWNHERPMWQLLMVNRQLRAEASAVLYSSRNNTFYFPIGGSLRSVSMFSKLWNGGRLVPPPIRKLDCAYDMRDFTDTASNVFEDAKWAYDDDERAPGGLSFEEIPHNERLEFLHRSYGYKLLGVWGYMAEVFDKMKLDLLRLDVSNARCTLGCCRYLDEALGVLGDFRLGRGPYPKRIEILGVLDHEKESLKAYIKDRRIMRKNRYVFVDKPGCTCDVSPRKLTSCESSS